MYLNPHRPSPTAPIKLIQESCSPPPICPQTPSLELQDCIFVACLFSHSTAMSKRPPSTSPPTARKRQTSTASSRASTQPPKADVDRSNLQAALHSSRASTCSSLASSLSSTISSSSSAAEPTSQSEGKLHRKTEEFSLPRIAGSAAQSPSTQRQSSSSTEPYTENVQKSKEPQRGPAEILSTTAAEERDIQLSLQSENGTRVRDTFALHICDVAVTYVEAGAFLCSSYYQFDIVFAFSSHLQWP